MSAGKIFLPIFDLVEFFQHQKTDFFESSPFGLLPLCLLIFQCEQNNQITYPDGEII